MGKVILVGAGPGDTGLITLKGKKYIEQAQCIIYDRLMSPRLLEWAAPGCEFIYVGKENHKHVLHQDEINQLLYEKAKAHELVVRLKGGDPYVFGRGGEEAAFLLERGVEVEVVPGVSSSVAALTAAGIPITHRGVAKGFHVITAHSKKDQLADISYDLLTDDTETCVFLMGLAHVEEIARGLVQAGRDADTLIAVISKGTTPRQKKWIGCLRDLVDSSEHCRKLRELESPAIIVVGDVVKYADTLSFFEHKPLFGKRYILPCIRTAEWEKNDRLADTLQEQGAEVIRVPVGEIVPVELPGLEEKVKRASWILFTSRNGVKAFFWNMRKQNLDLRILAQSQIGVIGTATAEELGKYYLYPDLVSKVQTGKGLAQELTDAMNRTGGEANQVVQIYGARVMDEELFYGLQGRCVVEKYDVYENRDICGEKNRGLFPAFEDMAGADGILFTSASNVTRTLALLGEAFKLPPVYSIGPKCSVALENAGIHEYREAETCSYEGLLSLVLERP